MTTLATSSIGPSQDESTADVKPVAVPDETSNQVRGQRLPTWPFTCIFVLFPLWWALGLVDVIIIPIALVMVLYLARVGNVRVPKAFGIWAVFLLFMAGSVIRLNHSSQLLVFIDRAGIYGASTVLFIYVFNARQSLYDHKVLGHLAAYWLTVVAGGFLGLIETTGSLKTPAYFILAKVSPGLVQNDLVRFMVVRQFSQYSPDNYFQIPPRPAAPFLYTNNWGNIYSLLLPIVIVVLMESRKRSWARRSLIVLLPVSAVPALLTLNRGMIIGLAITLVYVAIRSALRKNLRTVIILAFVGSVGVVLWFAPVVQQGLSTRTESSTTTRSSLYVQSIQAALKSPLLGYGSTIPSTGPWDPQVGTQGQFWIVLVSHGFVAVACFVGFYLLIVLFTLPRRDRVGMACNAVILVGTIEFLYYGAVPYGLPVMMTLAAVATRPSRNGSDC